MNTVMDAQATERNSRKNTHSITANEVVMPEEHCHVCPVWVGYLLASPIRRLFEKPEKILAPFVGKGMTVLDVGSAMGFFSLPMASMVGDSGHVICLDIQEKMLANLMKRASKKGLANRIEPRLTGSGGMGLEDLTGKVDFALASAVLHELPSQETFFAELFSAMKAGGKVLAAEPKGHVDGAAFARSLDFARAAGFEVESESVGRRTRDAVLVRKP